MSRQRLNIDQFLSRARVAIDNASHSPDIMAALRAFNYDASRLQQGADLLARAEASQAAQKRAYGQQFKATNDLEAAKADADQHYSAHRKLARLALKQLPDRQQALGLAGRKKESLAGWAAQANLFYTNALADPQILDAFSHFNLSVDKLEAAQASVRRVSDLDSDQELAKANAQQATQARDDILDQLDEWLVAFKAVAEIALAPQPQQLEALQFGAIE